MDGPDNPEAWLRPRRDRRAEAIKLRRAGWTLRDIQRELRAGREPLARWLKHAGFPTHEQQRQARRDGWAGLDWTLTDAELARRIHRDLAIVSWWRRRLRRDGLAGPARRPPGRTLDELLKAGLGRRPDEHVARTLKVSAETVRAWRLAHGLAAPSRGGRDEQGCGDAAAVLWRGGMLLAEIARYFRVSEVHVRAWLRERHIDSAHGESHRAFEKWSAVDWTRPVRALAREMRCQPSTVWKWRVRLARLGRVVAPFRPAVHTDAAFRAAGAGREVDAIVARRLGIHPGTVAKWRSRHGVPPLRQYAAARAQRAQQVMDLVTSLKLATAPQIRQRLLPKPSLPALRLTLARLVESGCLIRQGGGRQGRKATYRLSRGT